MLLENVHRDRSVASKKWGWWPHFSENQSFGGRAAKSSLSPARSGPRGGGGLARRVGRRPSRQRRSTVPPCRRREGAGFGATQLHLAHLRRRTEPEREVYFEGGPRPARSTGGALGRYPHRTCRTPTDTRRSANILLRASRAMMMCRSTFLHMQKKVSGAVSCVLL